MPSAIDEQTKEKVIQQWISGCPRDKIAGENNIGAGTVSAIINSYKIGLDSSDFELVRQLAVESKKQGLNLSDLASHFRLYNYFRKLGATENEIGAFITNVHLSDIPPEKVIQYVNQIYKIAKEESIPLDQMSDSIKQKIEDKKKIEEELREADTLLQNKNVSIEAINEHIKLNEEFNKHGLSTHDIPRLLNLLGNAKRYGFDGKEIASKLYNIQELEWKEKQLKDKCKKLSKRISKYKDVAPLAEEIAALQIGVDELIALKVGINEAAKHYNLPPLAATLRLIDDIKNIIKLMASKRSCLLYTCTSIHLIKFAPGKMKLYLI